MNNTEKNEETSFCTVTRLMALADDYADWAMAKGQEHPACTQTRQTPQDELRKLLGDSKANSVLFTPLSDEQKPRKGDWLDTTRPKYLDN